MQKFGKNGVFFVCYVSLPFECHTFRAFAADPMSPASVRLGGSLLPFLRRPAGNGEVGNSRRSGPGVSTFSRGFLGQVCNMYRNIPTEGEIPFFQTPPAVQLPFVSQFFLTETNPLLNLELGACCWSDFFYAFYHGKLP